MSKHIESKQGLKTLLKRLNKVNPNDYPKIPEFIMKDAIDYWVKVVQGCIDEGLAMDDVDYENAPRWFKPLWTGLR